jgi:pimeloyl-ACP methyl ester carboxylesterase
MAEHAPGTPENRRQVGGGRVLSIVAALTALLAVIGVALLALLSADPAEAAAKTKWAPLDRPGPALQVKPQRLENSLTCSEGGIADADRAPVLLVPATGVNFRQNFSWNYAKLFDDRGIPWCASDQPGFRNSNQTDIQLRGQYLTYAIRSMYETAGRKIAILGHSQGGMAMRWPLRFWPDTRKMVDDVIGFAGTNRGTDEAAGCDESCSPAGAQQGSDSDFIRALNSRTETFAGISYTEVYTTLDETVTPQPYASSVSGPGEITNVAIQDVCPNATSEHLMVGTSDPAGAALALDALNNPGPAEPNRINPLVCAQPYQPGIDPVTAPAEIAAAFESLFLAETPKGGEPPLRCYVFKRVRECRQERKGKRAG